MDEHIFKVQPRLRSGHVWLTELVADAAVTHSVLAAGLLAADNSFMDFFLRYLQPSAFTSFCFAHAPFSPVSLPIVSFVLQTEQWYCLSEAHLSLLP